MMIFIPFVPFEQSQMEVKTDLRDKYKSGGKTQSTQFAPGSVRILTAKLSAVIRSQKEERSLNSGALAPSVNEKPVSRSGAGSGHPCNLGWLGGAGGTPRLRPASRGPCHPRETRTAEAAAGDAASGPRCRLCDSVVPAPWSLEPGWLRQKSEGR